MITSASIESPPALLVNSKISLEGVVRWLRTERRDVPFGCFDWDPFAAQLADNIGMVQQDVTGLVATAFARIDAPAGLPEIAYVPCILRARDGT
ncbi:hypothetical protein NHG85_08635 [Limimaricola sp. ASW11-118]|uniref:Uncharacterized protein n=1 Tax=Limimaricola litoreus TaxID=2955316 RepID=A0A9X2FWT1_9RHOB|nr:hypothetical protein [Limimaricola litoreus]